jgi:hypothetical protein
MAADRPATAPIAAAGAQFALSFVGQARGAR